MSSGPTGNNPCFFGLYATYTAPLSNAVAQPCTGCRSAHIHRNGFSRTHSNRHADSYGYPHANACPGSTPHRYALHHHNYRLGKPAGSPSPTIGRGY